MMCSYMANVTFVNCMVLKCTERVILVRFEIIRGERINGGANIRHTHPTLVDIGSMIVGLLLDEQLVTNVS